MSAHTINPSRWFINDRSVASGMPLLRAADSAQARALQGIGPMNSASSAAAKSLPIHVQPRGPRLDLRALRALVEQCARANDSNSNAIVIDLSAIESIDSIAVTTLVSIQRNARGRCVALAGLSPAVQLVARVCHLHELFDIYTNADAAIRELSR